MFLTLVLILTWLFIGTAVALVSAADSPLKFGVVIDALLCVVLWPIVLFHAAWTHRGNK